jgi:hypothetical protein
MVGWVLGAAAVAIAVLFVGSRWRVYGRLFAPEHFIELARACDPLRAAAVARAADGPQAASAFAPDDPRAFLSHGALIVVYTAQVSGEQAVHHLSVSVAGHVTTVSAGSTFVPGSRWSSAGPWIEFASPSLHRRSTTPRSPSRRRSTSACPWPPCST